MRSFHFAILAGSIASAFVGASGCFAIANLDRFHSVDASPPAADAPSDAADDGQCLPGVDDPSRPSSLVINLTNMGVHFQQLLELRVIDSQNAIQSKIVIQPLDKAGSQELTVHVPSAIPTTNGPYRLDFYGDMNKSGGYDGIGNVLLNDHAWRISPLVDFPASTCHVANLVQVHFVHNTVFTDIDQWPTGTKNPASGTGLSARVTFAGASLASFRGNLLQLRIREKQSGHTVGTYRVPEIPSTNDDAGKPLDVVAVLPGVLDVGFDYLVDVYVDDGNGRYDDPSKVGSSDIGLEVPVRSTSGDLDAGGPADAAADAGTNAGTAFGIDLAIDLNTTTYPRNVDIGEP